MAIPIKQTVSRAVDLSFSVFAEVIKGGNFKKVVAYTPDPFTGALVNVYTTAPVAYLPLSFSSRDAVGSVVYGDEKWLIKASDLSGISPIPSSGDWFEAAGSLYDIKAAILDPTESLWTFQVRRNVPQPVASGPDQDWGDLSLYDSAEDWGTVAAFNDSSDDWNVIVPLGASEDRGDLSVFTSSDDFADLSLFGSFEDWNNS